MRGKQQRRPRRRARRPRRHCRVSFRKPIKSTLNYNILKKKGEKEVEEGQEREMKDVERQRESDLQRRKWEYK